MLYVNGSSMSEADTKLFGYVKNGTLTERILETLIKEGASLNAQNIDGDTPLHCAVDREDMQTVEKLLLSCANMDIENSKGLTPFKIAAIGAYPNRVDLLIWRGFSVLDDQGGFKQGIITGTEKYVKIAQLFIECKLLLDRDAKEPDFIEQRKDLSTYWNGCKVNKVPLQDNEINGEATTPHTSRNVNPLNPTVAQKAFFIMHIEPWYYDIDMEFIKYHDINIKVEEDDEYAVVKFLDRIQDDKGRLNLVLSALFDRNGDMDHELQSRITSKFKNLCNGVQKATAATATPTAPSCDAHDKRKKSKNPYQKVRFADEEFSSQPPLNPQTTSHKSQNPYDNAGMYSALGVAVVGFIAIGVMLCATGNPVLGGVFIAVPVISALISALILGIAKIYEEVSEKKEKKPEIDTLTALREVLTPQWLSKGRVSNI